MTSLADPAGALPWAGDVAGLAVAVALIATLIAREILISAPDDRTLSSVRLLDVLLVPLLLVFAVVLGARVF